MNCVLALIAAQFYSTDTNLPIIGESDLEEDELQYERRKTRNLLLSFNAIAFLVPLIAAGLIYGFFALKGESLEYRQWKTIIMLVWLGTLGLLFWTFAKNLRPRRSFGESENDDGRRVSVDEFGNTSRYEHRLTRRIVKDFFLSATVIPAITVLLVYVGLSAFNHRLQSAEWRNLFLIVWLVMIAVLAIRAAWMSRSRKLTVKK